MLSTLSRELPLTSEWPFAATARANQALEAAGARAFIEQMPPEGRAAVRLDTRAHQCLLADPELWRSAILAHLVVGQPGRVVEDAEAVKMLQDTYGVELLAAEWKARWEIRLWVIAADRALGGGVFTRIRDRVWQNGNV